MRVATGPVGAGEEQREATFVLVDVINDSEVDVMVTLRGALVDDTGVAVGTLTEQALRIPARGGRRTFAMVDSEAEARPGATSARLTVFGAAEMRAPAPVVITDGHVYDDRGRAVVAGYVVNETDQEISAVVIGGFYDEDGRPMKRPSTAFRLAAGGKRGVQFVGPDGSRSAYLFVGETVH